VGVRGRGDDLPLVTVIGDLVEDVVVHVRRPVRPATDNPAVVVRRRGGSAANVAAVAAAHGPSRFIGRVGHDPLGDALIADLAATGVDVRVQRGGRTGCIVVLVDQSGERTMFPDRGASAELDAIDPGWLEHTAVLHLPFYGFSGDGPGEHLLQAAATVRAGGGRVTVDLSASSLIDDLGAARLSHLMTALAPSIVFANDDEARAAGLRSSTPPRGCAYVVKSGPRPASIFTADGARFDVPAHEVETVSDTTGAGDAFAGGFLAAWAAGATLERACRAGHDAAARVVAGGR
jgi:sugar/nucleoside kinase (ribokinase family)